MTSIIRHQEIPARTCHFPLISKGHFPDSRVKESLSTNMQGTFFRGDVGSKRLSCFSSVKQSVLNATKRRFTFGRGKSCGSWIFEATEKLVILSRCKRVLVLLTVKLVQIKERDIQPWNGGCALVYASCSSQRRDCQSS